MSPVWKVQEVSCCSLLQTAAAWSFDWPPAVRTAGWTSGASPSVMDQVGLRWREGEVEGEKEREEGKRTVLTFKSLQWNNFTSVRTKSSADSLIMDHLMMRVCARVCKISCFMLTRRVCYQTTGWISVVNTHCCDFLRSVAMATCFFIFTKQFVLLCIYSATPHTPCLWWSISVVSHIFHSVDLYFFPVINSYYVSMKFYIFS